VVVLTGLALGAEERSRLLAGVEAVLSKGMHSADELQAELRALVRRSVGAARA
jgi:hypothetical protein